MNVSAWLRDLGLDQYVQAFRDNDVDEHTLRQLTVDDLVALGIKSVGHRRKLAEAIALLGGEPAMSASAPASSLPDDRAEQRQLTVLHCQTVAARARLHPETQREVVQRFHEICKQLV